MFPSSLASSSATAAPKQGKDHMEPRLLAMFLAAGVKDETLNKLGPYIKTMSLLTAIADTKEAFRKFLEMDTVMGKPNDITTTMEQAAVMSVYKAALTTVSVEVEAQAKRRLENKPPQLKMGELDTMVKVYENSPGAWPITRVMTPSQAYVERKILELESSWVPESLSRVTNREQQDINLDSGLSYDTSEKQFKLTQKDFGVPLPADSEGLRARWATMGMCFIFVKLKHPQVGVLQSAELSLFDRYTAYMFGPQVWGMSIKDEYDRVTSTPHIGMVLRYDKAVRQLVADNMNAGIDVATAFGIATAHEQTKTLHFTTAFNAENSTPRCRMCSAPGIRESHRAVVIPTLSHPLDHPAPFANGPSAEGPGPKAEANREKRNRAKAAKAKAKASAQGVIKKPKALMNGGLGDHRGAGKQGGGKDKGKGAGKGAGRLKFKTDGGLSICFAYNNKQPCKSTPCPHAHVCQMCEGDHPKEDPSCPFMKRA